MPELPEVETTRQGILPHVTGKTVRDIAVRHHGLRWPVDPQLPAILTNKKLQGIERRGKYLLFQFKHGHLIIHLGMSGSLRIVNPYEVAPKAHDHIDIIFNKTTCLRYHDPRRFGCVLWTGEPISEHALLSKLGPEPLSDAFNAEYLFAASRKRTKDAKQFIMDSHIVVGVGNIYANESLFSAGIRPTRAAGKLTRKQCEQWVTEIKRVLARSIEQGGTTLRDFVGGDGKPGYFAQQLLVYGRAGKPCVQCTSLLQEIKQGQRSSVYCPRCQK